MHEIQNIQIDSRSKKLKDFIPLVIAFFLGLVVLSLYQNTSLYFSGVLDSILNRSFFILLLHHLGFASVCAIFLAFLFNLLENWKPGKGFFVVKVIIMALLLLEVVLVNYYVKNYEALGTNLFGSSGLSTTRLSIFQVVMVFVLCITVCHFSYRYISSFYRLISRMYPFTIILLSLFLATLYSEKKTVNENKTQHLLERMGQQIFITNTYGGTAEYPLLKTSNTKTKLGKYFNLQKAKPTIKIIIVDGLGSDFINKKGFYTGFMPHLSALKNKSLYWANFLSNTGEGNAAIPTIVASLPFGEKGFTHLENLSHRNTLYSILGENDYRTSFNYGGNSALNAYDRFLYEEGVNQILDKKAFGNGYVLQDQDAAGISLGYPDKELFKRYHSTIQQDTIPNLDILVTLSTKEPYQIPEMELYVDKVNKILSKKNFKGKAKRIVSKHEELFASFIYTDEAIEEFFLVEKERSSYNNTIYIITGSHYTSALPQNNALSRYRVPLIIYSQLIKSNREFYEIASHADIVPTLLSMLNEKYQIDIPEEVAWLGSNLQSQKDLLSQKQIPLLRSSGNIQDYILGSHFLTDGSVYKMDVNLNLSESKDEKAIEAIKEDFNYFKGVNSYVTVQDKIIPKSVSLVTHTENEFTKEQEIWIQSVFNGKDFDQAYRTARKLAIDKEWKRALLLCRYILNEIPRHPDAEILMGRLYAWQAQYDKSIRILEKVIQKYPEYEDGYCALLDTYHWAGKDEHVFRIMEHVKENNLTQELLSKKITRSVKKAQQKRILEVKEERQVDKNQLVKTNSK